MSELLEYSLLGLVILCLVSAVDGYPTGAPAGTCFTRYPKHKGTGTQTTPCPIHIQLSTSTYSSGEEIKVVVEDPSPNKELFAGIQIAAFKDSDLDEEIVGQFLSFQPINKLKIITCLGGYKNMVTHRIRVKVQKVELTWKAPSQNIGNITFKATIVANFNTFWTKVESKLSPTNKHDIVIKPPNLHISKPMVHNIDFSRCGTSTGCFLYPQHCRNKDCLVAVSFRYYPSKDSYMFEIYSKIAQNWIALGFSEDKLMGQDETVSCVSNSGQISIQYGWNPGYRNERMPTRYLSRTEIKHADGQLQCRFMLPRKSAAYIINQDASEYNYTKIKHDRNKEQYLMVAWGKAMPASDVLSKHTDIPVITYMKVDLKDKGIYRGTSFPTLVKVHVALMMIAWIFFGGIVTVVSRHYRNFMPTRRMCGSKIWFQVHRELAIFIVILTALGLIAIFAQYGAEIRLTSIPHSYVGLAVVAAVCVQVIAGSLRPEHSHSLRFLFNWGHRFLGQTTHILAAVTMFLAYDIEYFSADMRIFGYAVLSVWIVVQLLWHITFEILSLVGSRNKSEESNKADVHDMLSLQTILLIIYILTLSGICTAALLAFLLF